MFCPVSCYSVFGLRVTDDYLGILVDSYLICDLVPRFGPFYVSGCSMFRDKV